PSTQGGPTSWQIGGGCHHVDLPAAAMPGPAATGSNAPTVLSKSLPPPTGPRSMLAISSSSRRRAAAGSANPPKPCSGRGTVQAKRSMVEGPRWHDQLLAADRRRAGRYRLRAQVQSNAGRDGVGNRDRPDRRDGLA